MQFLRYKQSKVITKRYMRSYTNLETLIKIHIHYVDKQGNNQNVYNI